jgi:hypothetical protein
VSVHFLREGKAQDVKVTLGILEPPPQRPAPPE